MTGVAGPDAVTLGLMWEDLGAAGGTAKVNVYDGDVLPANLLGSYDVPQNVPPTGGSFSVALAIPEPSTFAGFLSLAVATAVWSRIGRRRRIT